MGYERQKDFGTPASRSSDMVTLTIDGRDVTVPAGTSVMRAAGECGGSIPSLCATDSVKAFGSCRMCLVEIDGMRGTRGARGARGGRIVYQGDLPGLLASPASITGSYATDSTSVCAWRSAHRPATSSG